jgi:hypothetical protein
MDIFKKVYEDKKWGDNNDTDYNGSSGIGSSIDYNVDYVDFLKKFLQLFNISSVVDLGCGDFRIGNMVFSEKIQYTGYDIYDKIIYKLKQENPLKNFEILDFCNNIDSIKNAQLCIIKDVLQHWPDNIIKKFLDELVAKRKFTFILVTNCMSDKNYDIENIGDFRGISDQLDPYFPETVFMYKSKKVQLISRFIYKRDFEDPRSLGLLPFPKLKIIGNFEPTKEQIILIDNKVVDSVCLGKETEQVIIQNNKYYIVCSGIHENFICYNIEQYPFKKILVCIK